MKYNIQQRPFVVLKTNIFYLDIYRKNLLFPADKRYGENEYRSWNKGYA
jgi:hypothetical protein